MEYVDRCLKWVLSTNYHNFEIIFVDNASTDGSLEYVKRRYCGNPKIEMLRNNKNYGYAKGNNIGVKVAKGKYIAFLNVDTEVEPDWLSELVKVMEISPNIGAAQAKLLRMDDKRRFDTCGHMLTPLGFTYERGLNELDATQYDHISEILGAKGAALIIRKKVFEEAGGFDEDFFLLREETDLCWRIWLRGYRVVFAPKAVVYHAVGGSFKSSNDIQPLYYFARNMLITLVKNLELRNIVKIVPIHILSSFADSILTDLRVKKTNNLISMFNALRWLIMHFRLAWRKHLEVMKIRRVKDKEVFNHVMVSVAEKLRERRSFKVVIRSRPPNRFKRQNQHSISLLKSRFLGFEKFQIHLPSATKDTTLNKTRSRLNHHETHD